MKDTIIKLLVGISIMTIIIILIPLRNSPKLIESKPLIPSPYEIQKMLNEYEPDNLIEVDGKIGPETLAKWERCFCNQSAERAFE